MTSGLFSLNFKDLVNGLVVAVGGALAGVIGDSVSAGTFNVFMLDWHLIGQLALSAAVGYLLKKFFSTPDGKVFGHIG